ncbi:MAG: hypothetical protein ACLU5I_04755 [Alistipes finegoldii]
MCENTFLDYRHESDELLELFPQSASVEFSLWLPTVQTSTWFRRGEPIQPDALGFDRQGFSLYPAAGAGLLHRRRQLLTYMTLYLEERSSVGMK